MSKQPLDLVRIFGLAMELGPEERRAFVEKACGGDRGAIDELLELLAYHDRADSGFLTGGPLGSDDLPEVLFERLAGRFTPPRATPRTLAGRRLAGRYELKHELGSGGSGTVYRAFDHVDGRHVAVKALSAEAAATYRHRRGEIAALRLLRLPGVVRFLDECEEDGWTFVVTELVEGTPFPGDRRDRSFEAVGTTFRSFLEALARIHWAGYLHRDIKPENVLVDAHGHATILDLGTAVLDWESAEERPEERRGTLAYLAPEQLENEPATVSSDLYAVGVLFYQALAGRLPHEARTRDELMQARLGAPAPSLSDIPAVPEHVARTVDRLLLRDPADRPGSAQEVLALLLAGGRAGEVDPPFVGRDELLDDLMRAARDGRSVDLWGARGLGRTACLRALEARLRSAGRGVVWTEPAERDFASLGPLVARRGPRGAEPAEATVLRLLEELAQEGGVLLADDAELLDARSARALDEVRRRAVVIRAFATPGPKRVALEPLTEAALRPLFVGSDRVLHLREDAARALHERTGGVPAAVARELGAWTRARIARREGDGYVVDRPALERLASGVLPALHAEAPARAASARLEHAKLLAWAAVAGPFATVDLLAEALEETPRAVRNALAELERTGWIVRRGRDQAVVVCLPPQVSAFIDEHRLPILASLVYAAPSGSDACLYFLTASDETARIPSQALALCRRRIEEGRIGQAAAILTHGLAAARRAGKLDLGPELLIELLQLALLQNQRRGVELFLYEVERTPVADPALEPIRDLGRAALVALSGETARAVALLDAIGEIAEPTLERWRRGILLVASHAAKPSTEEAILNAAVEWAARQRDPEIEAACAGWRGWFSYREERYAEAARLHAACAERSELAITRIGANLAGASAWMEAFELERAEELARRALEDARAQRYAEHEARAEWLLRTIAYRRGDAREPDFELVDAAAELGQDLVAALASVTEAAIAWRSGARGSAVELAQRAAGHWHKIGKEEGEILAACLAVAAGAPAGEAELDALAERASRCVPADLGLQALALLAAAHPERRVDWRGPAERLESRVRKARWDARLDVLSLDEARAYLHP